MAPRQYLGDDWFEIIFGVLGSLIYVAFSIVRVVVVAVVTGVRRMRGM